MKQQIHNHGYVKLIKAWGDESEIIESARMSTGGSFNGWEKDFKLLKYLYDNNHATPFEFVGATFEIKAPIFVFREWHRHRTQCLSGDQEIVFNRPCDGLAYRLTMKELFDKWHYPLPKRQRYGRTYREVMRERISKMSIRGTDGASEHITDVIYKGTAKVYKVITSYGSVTCTDNHRFKTSDGESTIAKGLTSVRVVRQAGAAVENVPIELSQEDLVNEIWVEYKPGYEVSNMGRVRSYFRQGVKVRQDSPVLKKLTSNTDNRLIVNIAGSVHQVSRLVAKCFIRQLTEGDHVLHKDDNAFNNKAANLYIGADSDNAKDRILHDSQTRLREVTADVIAIEEVGEQDVYDLSVTGDHWFCADNILVHNSYNEASARYIPLPNDNYLPTSDRVLRGIKEAGKNKQAGSNTEYKPKDFELESWLAMVASVYDSAENVYQYGLSIGVPKELARITIPVSRYSTMRVNTNLRNWLSFLLLRQAPNAQEEIRVYADAVAHALTEEYPKTMQLFNADAAK